MPKVTFISASGEEFVVEAHSGETLMEAARHNDVPGILADCGGACACATCHVYVEQQFFDKLEARSDMESDMLEFAESEVKPNSRLSCQIVVADDLEGMRVTVPQD